MKYAKRALIFVLVLSLLAMSAACSSTPVPEASAQQETPAAQDATSTQQESAPASGEVRELIFAHILDTQNPAHIGAMKMDEVLQELSDGTMKLNIFPDSALGNEEDVLALQQQGGGTIDLSLPSSAPLQALRSEFLCCDFPFAFSNYDQVWAFYDGEFGNHLMDSLDGTGVIGLGFWDNGFRNLTTTKTPVNSVDDLKGLKIRTMSARVHMASFNAMGAAATPVPWAEVYSALQQGVVDGQENPVANISGGKLYEVQDYLILSRHFHDVAPLVISEDTWRSLTEEQQGWIQQAAQEAGSYMRQVSEEGESEVQQALIKQGMTLIDLDEDALEGFRTATANVTDEFAAEIGQETLDLYYKCLEEARG